MTDFLSTDMLPLGADQTPYRLITTEGVGTEEVAGRTFLNVAPEALQALSFEAIRDTSHLLRPEHLAQLRSIFQASHFA